MVLMVSIQQIKTPLKCAETTWIFQIPSSVCKDELGINTRKILFPSPNYFKWIFRNSRKFEYFSQFIKKNIL